MATMTQTPEIVDTPIRAQLHGLLDAIELLAAARSTGIAAALADCSHEIRRSDDDDTIHYTAIDHDGHTDDVSDCAACEDELGDIRDSLPAGWLVEWTGDGNGTELDVSIEVDDVWQRAIDHLESQIDDARAALAEADEPRVWSLRECGAEFRTLIGTREDAIDEAKGCTDGDYGEVTSTCWTDIHAICEESDEHESVTVEIEPDEPDCTHEDGHDWQSPHEVVGGIEENPGVQGHGGGVVFTEVCAHCGAYRITDTWAQRPDTGEQGLHEVAYREADDESRTWVESVREDEDDE